MKNLALKLGSAMAFFFVISSVSTACFGLFNEPKMPAQLIQK